MTDTTNTQQLAKLQKEVLDLQLAAIKNDIVKLASDLHSVDQRAADRTEMVDHEKRIRILEESSTKVNTLIYMVFGGGIISVVNLYLLLTGK